MKNEKFVYDDYEGFLEDGKKIGIWEVLLHLNKMNNLLKEVKLELDSLNNKDLIEKINEVISDE